MSSSLSNFYNKVKNIFQQEGTRKIIGTQLQRWESQNATVTENQIKEILQKKFPNSQTIKVEDISGGCGVMFNIFIETSDFKGLSIPKQHKAVYDSLNEQIKNIHGLHLETKVPS